MTDQNTLFAQYLEELTEAITDLEHFSVERTYAALKDLCVLFRVGKALAEYFNSEEAERKGDGVIRVCYDSGEDPEEVISYRSVLNDMMVVNCRAFRMKGAAPWSEEERKRILMIERLMISVIGRMRMAGMLAQATLYDDAGYSNFRYFNNMLERIGSAGKLNLYAVARFNLKHFALMNRQLGRDVSDRIMRQYIIGLQNITDSDGAVSRLGGDNFVTLFRKEELQRVLAHFTGVPVQFSSEEQGRVMVSARAGIFQVPEDYYYHDVGDVMDRITSACAAAKAGDAGDIVFSNEQMQEAKERVMRIRQSLPMALENEEILVFYQPKISLKDNAMVGAEALSRWHHNGRLIMPREFIPVLEQTMDICKLDFYVLDRVCRDLRRWLDEGRHVVRVSVNLSRRHLIDMDLTDRLLSVIDKYHVPHEYLEFELTEATTEIELKDLKRVVSALQDAGVAVSVDDFGVGYSSMDLIGDIPWDTLKVDKAFLPGQNETENDRQHIMFRHVVNMAKEIGLTCVAEGAETGGQVDMLRRNGCDIAQGFYYDQPLPVREFEKRIDLPYYTIHNA